MFLGHIISKDGVSVDPAKVEVVVNWPRPANVSEVRSFLELVGYDQRFVKDFSTITTPLTNLTCKDTKFAWNEKCDQSFQILKERLTSAPVLALSSGSGGFVIFSDASIQGLGWVMMQHVRVGGLPLCFTLFPYKLRYCYRLLIAYTCLY